MGSNSKKNEMKNLNCEFYVELKDHRFRVQPSKK